MSYNEKETNKYNSMMADFEHFAEMKRALSKNKCPVHNKKLKMEAHWENDYDIDIFISKYCCMDFAKQMKKEFLKADRFTSVTIA